MKSIKLFNYNIIRNFTTKPKKPIIKQKPKKSTINENFKPGPSGKESGGPLVDDRSIEPTIHGDWQKKGRCTDF